MPPKRATSTSRSSTVLFKKHKITVLLSLQPNEPLTAVKEKLHDALKSRELREINGDQVPEDSSCIEFGLPVDRNDLEKGWTPLADHTSVDQNGDVPQTSTGIADQTAQAAGLTNGHPVAFRFRKSGEVKDDELERDLNHEDPGWDVVIPSFEDEDEEY
ncbi:hypothetical protein N7478_003400 [Penicillium angulare]|uniref:uncharacterized protein n=1 Tax=Penicillium angulare TaxID=116970 RepID=UPI002542390F|nr:uncharacterized protein N7478_003400 [Penicillium angulare]KAJ5287714.1 hypothetical protein N7478_003400 [Penicillium angulare]